MRKLLTCRGKHTHSEGNSSQKNDLGMIQGNNKVITQ